MKTYNIQYGVGKTKYLVNFHDGIKTHKDGSKFSDIKIFSNRKKMEGFIKKLRSNGYSSRSIL
jgi:hypothetical protein